MKRMPHYQKFYQFSFVRILTSFVMSRPEEFCSDITVYRAGVA